MTTESTTSRSQDWWHLAACAGHDPEWWSADDHQNRTAAVRICASCPVRPECLADAVRRHDFGVVRGGALFGARGARVVSLVCARCDARPALTATAGSQPYCRVCRRETRHRGEDNEPYAAQQNIDHGTARG
ncbi:MAG: WhiB family transcriptional regulator [Micromonosporaceae bacterium]